MTLHKHRPGIYQFAINPSHYGQVRRVESLWQGEIRETVTNAFVTYAGIWTTRKEAIAAIQAKAAYLRNGGCA